MPGGLASAHVRCSNAKGDPEETAERAARYLAHGKRTRRAELGDIEREATSWPPLGPYWPMMTVPAWRTF